MLPARKWPCRPERAQNQHCRQSTDTMAVSPAPQAAWSLLAPWAQRHRDKLDRHLLLALATGFADHVHAASGPFDVMLRLATPQASAWLRSRFARHPSARLSSAHLDAASVYVSASVNLALLEELAGAAQVIAIEWGQPVRAQRTVDRRATASPVTAPAAALPQCAGEVLLGVIDHGCPFAHQAFRQPKDARQTRVLAIWDQDRLPDFDPADGAPSGFAYGRQSKRAYLNGHMAAALQNGVVDENRCYALARYSAMRDALTHGSHTVGLFAGSWISPSLKAALAANDPATPGAASPADLVFVQLPRGVLQSPSHGGDHQCILDGIRYVVACAGKSVKTIVVVVDYGSYLGPHDGSSFIEMAMQAMVQEQRARGRDLKLVFPTGNGFSDNTHARATLSEGPTNMALRVSSNSETAGFAEIWLPESQKNLKVSITLPSGHGQPKQLTKHLSIDAPGAYAWPQGPGVQSACFNAIRMDMGASGTVILLRTAPTLVSDGAMAQAPAGRYVLALDKAANRKKIKAGAENPPKAFFYSCWGGENLGFPKRSQQARWLPLSPNGAMDGKGSILGTACTPGVFAVAGQVYNASGRGVRLADYSGQGPTRGKTRPVHLAMSDDSLLKNGVLGLGTRSGATARMWGTSVAAPIAARRLRP